MVGRLITEHMGHGVAQHDHKNTPPPRQLQGLRLTYTAIIYALLLYFFLLWEAGRRRCWVPSLSVTRLRGPTWTPPYNPPVPEALGSPLAWESIRPVFTLRFAHVCAHAGREKKSGGRRPRDTTSVTQQGSRKHLSVAHDRTLKSARSASLP